MKTTITIKTRAGKLIERKAEVIDYINNAGNQYSIAYVGRSAYHIDQEERMATGSVVWSAK